MFRNLFVVFILILQGIGLELYAQKTEISRKSEQKISSHVRFLSMPSLEGREPGSAGAVIAADYISSQMYGSGLLPVGENYINEVALFKINNKKGQISFFNRKASICALTGKNDFSIPYGFVSADYQSEVVFAGYGIKSETTTYNDYNGLDVKNKVVMILDGGPEFIEISGEKKAITIPPSETFLSNKIATSQTLGAKLLIVIINETEEPAATEELPESEDYQDFEWILPTDTVGEIPFLKLNYEGSTATMKYLGINPSAVNSEHKMEFGEARASVYFETEIEKVPAYNIIGRIPGKCSDSCIIIGAHYDHLGKRGNDIYYGADDNASGVAAMLSLAEDFASSGYQPQFDLIFAAWTAEEKGLLGSNWFASNLKDPAKVKLYINMDMVSRSAPDDTLRKILSAGTRVADTLLRTKISEINDHAGNPFTLDLWYVDGHSGSDYAPFIEKGIPVVTFFSGFHDDYHTPGDTFDRIDQEKLSRIVKFIDRIISGLIFK